LAQAASDTGLIETFASFDLPNELASFGSTHASSEHSVRLLTSLDWGVINAAAERNDPKFDAALSSLRETACLDESIAPLDPQLRAVADSARSLLMQASPVAPSHEPRPEQSTPPPPSPAHAAGHVTHTTVAELDVALANLKKAIRSETQARDTDRVTITWQVDDS